jgi:tight adherence protein B
MSAEQQLTVLKFSAIALLAAGCVLGFVRLSVLSDTALRRAYSRYVASLERRMRLMFIETKGSHVAMSQAGAILVIAAIALITSSPLAWLGVPLVALAPSFVLERKRKKRLQKIEQKLDGFVLALANALRAMPSAGKALASVLPVTPAPLDREIELVLREMRVGSTLEQALGHLSARVQSFQLDAALSGLLIGRQTGGNVPEILDGAANTLREMARLQGVLRAKTAEGRAQANVLAAFPLLLVVVFDAASPGYFRPLTESAAGVMVMMIAVGLWITSVLMTRKIMEVQL